MLGGWRKVEVGDDHVGVVRWRTKKLVYFSRKPLNKKSLFWPFLKKRDTRGNFRQFVGPTLYIYIYIFFFFYPPLSFGMSTYKKSHVESSIQYSISIKLFKIFHLNQYIVSHSHREKNNPWRHNSISLPVHKKNSYHIWHI